MYTETPLSYEF